MAKLTMLVDMSGSQSQYVESTLSPGCDRVNSHLFADFFYEKKDATPVPSVGSMQAGSALLILPSHSFAPPRFNIIFPTTAVFFTLLPSPAFASSTSRASLAKSFAYSFQTTECCRASRSINYSFSHDPRIRYCSGSTISRLTLPIIASTRNLLSPPTYQHAVYNIDVRPASCSSLRLRRSRRLGFNLHVYKHSLQDRDAQARCSDYYGNDEQHHIELHAYWHGILFHLFGNTLFLYDELSTCF